MDHLLDRPTARTWLATAVAEARAGLAEGGIPVGAALYGVEHRIEPTPPLQRDAYATDVPEHLAFPGAFRDGIDRFRASNVARELFGDTFVDHYADTREWQEREFRGLVTDRELERFFELS